MKPTTETHPSTTTVPPLPAKSEPDLIGPVSKKTNPVHHTTSQGPQVSPTGAEDKSMDFVEALLTSKVRFLTTPVRFHGMSTPPPPFVRKTNSSHVHTQTTTTETPHYAKDDSDVVHPRDSVHELSGVPHNPSEDVVYPDTGVRVAPAYPARRFKEEERASFFNRLRTETATENWADVGFVINEEAPDRWNTEELFGETIDVMHNANKHTTAEIDNRDDVHHAVQKDTDIRSPEYNGATTVSVIQNVQLPQDHSGVQNSNNKFTVEQVDTTESTPHQEPHDPDITPEYRYEDEPMDDIMRLKDHRSDATLGDAQFQDYYYLLNRSQEWDDYWYTGSHEMTSTGPRWDVKDDYYDDYGDIVSENTDTPSDVPLPLSASSGSKIGNFKRKEIMKIRLER